MDPALTEQLIQAFLRLKKLRTPFPMELPLSHAEFFLLHTVSVLMGRKGGAPPCVNVSSLRERLDTSMPAVSQLLSGLERKRLIVRAIAPGDRRKIDVALTEKGEALLRRTRAHTDRSLLLIVERLGENDMREFIRICTRVSEIFEELQAERRGAPPGCPACHHDHPRRPPSSP